MQRSSVDLPEPEAPIRQTTSCSADREVDAAQDLQVAERLVQALDQRGRASTAARHRAPAARWRRSRATSQSVNRASGIVISTMKTSAADDVGREVEGRGLLDLRPSGSVSTTPRTTTSDGVLLEADEVVEQRRDHPTHGLREDDVAQRLATRQPERPGGRLLARVDGLDAGAVDLGHVRRVHERQRDRPPRRTADLRDPLQLRAPGIPKPSMKMTRIVGIAAEEVRVDRRRPLRSGKKTGPGRLRSTAISSPTGRMSTSAMRNSLTLTKNASAISGNDVL